MTIEIANRLIELRKNAGLSQEELAEKIGVSRQAISKWERAEACPETENLIELSKLYGVSIDSILKGEPKEAPKEEKVEEAEVVEEAEPVEAEVVDPAEERIIIDEDEVHKSVFEKVMGAILFPLLVVAYILMGLLWKGPNQELVGWSVGWNIFLLGIFFASIPFAIRKRRASRLAVAPLVVAIYVGGCMLAGIYLQQNYWHPGWLIFFFIPIYHGICGGIESALKK